MFSNLRNKEIKFSRVAQAEDDVDSEALISSPPSSEKAEYPRRSSLSRLWTALLFFVTFAVALVLGLWIGRKSIETESGYCISKVSNYCECMMDNIVGDGWIAANVFSAPLLEDVEIEYEMVRFNGSLLHENIFRQSGSPEVDAAWESLGTDCSYSHFTPHASSFTPSRPLLTPPDTRPSSNRPD